MSLAQAREAMNPLKVLVNKTNALQTHTMTTAVPTGIKVSNWIAAMYGGSVEVKTPMLFCGKTCFLCWRS